MNINLMSKNTIGIDNQQNKLQKKQLDYLNNKWGVSSTSQEISFKKKGVPEIASRIIDKTSKRATEDKSIKEKILASGRFGKMLNFILENEVLTQAGITFLIGWGLRVPTILSLPECLGGKHKEDKALAAAHSGASVTIGLFSACALTLAFNRGTSYVKKVLYKFLNPKILKERHPQLDLNSIKDKTGNLLDKSFWKNIDGKAFYEDVKTPMTMSRPKFLSEIADSTYKSRGIDIDMSANKGKNLYEYTTKKGTKLVDELGLDDLCVAIKDEGMGTTVKGLSDTNFFSLKYIDKDYLLETLRKSKSGIDESTVVKDNKVLHPKNWKMKNGENANVDLYLSDFRETAEGTPVYTGKKRLEANGVQKYVAYQRNGENGGLGTEITNEMLKADAKNDTQDKTIGWLVDIVTRIPMGLLTVAMIPSILNLFDLKKGSDKNIQKEVAIAKEQNVDNIANKKLNEAENSKNVENKNVTVQSNAPTFKGKGNSKNSFNFIDKFLGKNYSFKMLNSEKVRNSAENFRKTFKMDMTQVMTILGSFLTSGSYIVGTLSNDKLDKDRRKTLAINQFLGFLIPTFLGVAVNKKLDNKVKEYTYDFVNQQIQKIKLMEANGKIESKNAEKLIDNVIKAKKGIPVLAKLTVFAMIYRYLTPVAITPIANWMGDHMNDFMAKRNANKNNGKILNDTKKVA